MNKKYHFLSFMINQSKQEQSFGLVDLFIFVMLLPFYVIIFSAKFIYFYVMFAFYGFILLMIITFFIIL